LNSFRRKSSVYQGEKLKFAATIGIFYNFQGNYMRKYDNLDMRYHVKLGLSLRVLYCVVDTGYGLGRSLGDCRPALPKG
jgi:hypothetical protein